MTGVGQGLKQTLAGLFLRLSETGRAPFIVSVIILGYGLLSCVVLGDTIRFWDEQNYLQIAESLARRYSFSAFDNGPTAFRPIGYPLLLACCLKLGGSVAALRFLNYIALAACAYILYFLILKRTKGRYGATIAPFLILCYPVLLYTAGTLYPQTIASAIFLFLIFRLTDSKQTLSFLNGALTGFLVLVVPSFLSFVPVLGALPLVFTTRFSFRKAAIFFVGAALIIGSWAVRNYVVFDRFILLSTNMGVNLLLGNSGNASPNRSVLVDITPHVREVERLRLDEVEADRYYRSRALEWMRANPAKALTLYFAKVLNYFNFYNELATENERAIWKNVIMFVTYYPLLLLMVIRMFLRRRVPVSRIEVVFVALYIYSAFLAAVFFPRIRFRLPFDFLVIGVASAFLNDFLKARMLSGDSRPPCCGQGIKDSTDLEVEEGRKGTRATP